ncbi:MAG: hypothetical protein R3D30_10760, partial [Hyphomicrobiales bacterium]
KIPGQLASTDVNKFSGNLYGTVGKGLGVLSPKNWVTGAAVGSFAANGDDKSAGIIGNWNAAANGYRAAGVFGAGRTNFSPNVNFKNSNLNIGSAPGGAGPTSLGIVGK